MSLTLKSIQFVLPNRAIPFPLFLRLPDPCHPGLWMRVPVCLPEWPPRQENNGLAPVMIPLSLASNGMVRFSPEVTIESSEPGTFSIAARPFHGDYTILGRTTPKQFSFTEGALSSSQQVDLEAPRLSNWSQHQVDFHKDKWIWEATPIGGGAPFEFACSAIDVYTTLGVPRSPWKFSGANDEFWLEILQLACEWAKGAKSAAEAATRVTRGVFSLGHSALPLFYERSSQYTNGSTFDAERFLARILDGDLRYSSVVNCQDVASIVTTFANMLGADLHQSQLGSDIDTREIFLIGHRCLENAFFELHEVAWGGAGTSADPVWDACLAFPGLGGGGAPDNAAGLAFSGSSNDYADRLLQHKGSAGPTGPPCGTNNRSLGPVPVVGGPTGTILSPRAPDLASSGIFTLRFAPDVSDLPEFRITGWRSQEFSHSITAFLSVWQTTEKTADHRLQVTAVPLDSPEAAHDYLAFVISRFSLPVERVPGIGDLAYASRTDGPPRSLTVLIVGNLFLNVENIGIDFVDTLPIAERLIGTLFGEPFGPVPMPPGGIRVEDFLSSLGSPAPDQTVALHASGPLRLVDGKIVGSHDSPLTASGTVRKTALSLASPML